MKTLLPKEITNLSDAVRFLILLNSVGESYHPEDKAASINWPEGAKPSEKECKQLDKLMEDIYQMEGNNGNHANPKFDPCAFLNGLHNESVKETLESMGYVQSDTGGSCTAYIKEGYGGEIYITKMEDPSMPEKMDEPISVGYYIEENDGQIGNVLHFANLSAFLVTGERQCVNNIKALEKIK